MKQIIKISQLAGFTEFWAMLFKAEWCGIPCKRDRYLMVASMEEMGNWFLQQVTLNCSHKLTMYNLVSIIGASGAGKMSRSM